MSNAAATAIRDGPIRPAIVFEFAMDCLPAQCRCGTSTDKNTHREKPVRRSAATGPTPAISRRERAEKERAPPLHDKPKGSAPRRATHPWSSSLLSWLPRRRHPLVTLDAVVRSAPQRGLINVRFAPKAIECCVAAKRRSVPGPDVSRCSKRGGYLA